MNIKIKKLHPDAKMPFRVNPTDAGADLVAISKKATIDGWVYGTGLSFEMPNSVGVIDSDYRGEVKAIFAASKSNPITYDINDRVAQLLIVPIELATFTEVGELSDTERGVEDLEAQESKFTKEVKYTPTDIAFISFLKKLSKLINNK